MNNVIKSGNVPLGFGMALSQNLTAMNRFAALSPQKQKAVIDGTHNITSKSQMQRYVNDLAEMSYS